MSFFKVNHSEASDFSPIPEGSYEAFISDIEIVSFKSSGNRGLKATYTIRNDVNQAGQKRKVWDNAPVMESTMFKYQNWAKATALPDGASFNNAEEMLIGFVKHLKGKPIRITIKHDKTKTEFIEQVSGVEASKLGAITGASTTNAPQVPAGLNPPVIDTFNMPGLQGLTPPSGLPLVTHEDPKPPWEQ